MKFTRRKKESEKNSDTVTVDMSVEEWNKMRGYPHDRMWHCDKCNILFEPKDAVVVIKNLIDPNKVEIKCPRYKPRKAWLGTKIKYFRCNQNLLTAEEDYWNAEYLVSDAPL